MEHELIKRVIYDQHELIAREQIIPRDYHLESGANYVLTGLRRAGKSTMLHALAQRLVAEGASWDEITYVNFEDERLAEFRVSDFDDIVAVQSEMCGGHGHFFFDEIQNVDGWERFARRLADLKEHVHITGSNAKMLSGEIEGALGGRYLTKRIDTYSFSEYLDATGTLHGERDLLAARAGGLVRNRFAEYMRYGGFPESTTYEDKRGYASSVYQKTLLGDIVARNRVRNANALGLLVKKVAESVCSDVSYSRLHRALKSTGVSISKDAVIDYISFAKEAYLVFSIENYFAKFADREGTPRYYFADNGLLNLFLFQKDTALLENAVAVYLHRKFPDALYFLKSPTTGIDIDFYVPEVHTAVQVVYALRDSSYEREVGNLAKLAESFDGANRFVVVTYGEEQVIEAGDITVEVVPAHKFLLS